jgi:uncharacterized protein (TIGR03437 family)
MLPTQSLGAFYQAVRYIRHRSLLFLSVALICLVTGGLLRGPKPAAAVAQTQPTISSVSAASFENTVTPEGIAAGFGSNLAAATISATSVPLPSTLGGVSVTVGGRAAGLFFVSANQINYLVPPDAPLGEDDVVVRSNGNITHMGKVTVARAAPAIFAANSNGVGVAAAVALRAASGGAQSFEQVAVRSGNTFVTRPLSLDPATDRVFLILFLCGVRGLANSDGNNNNGVAENVRVLLAGTEVAPSFAGRQGSLAGLDQLNLELSRSLIGRGKIKLAVNAGGLTSNEVEIEIAGTTGTNPPVVASFAPALATASEQLNVNGSGFSTVPENNVVLVNGLETHAIDSASPTQLVVRVPFGAEGGRVAVRTTQGEGASSNNVSLRTTLSGIVTDTNGSPLPGVEVSFGSIKTTTRNDGTYLLRDVVAGLGALTIDPSELPLTPPMQSYSKFASATANRDTVQGTTALQPITGAAASVQTSNSSATEESAFAEDRLLAPAGSVSNGGVTFSFPDNTIATFPAGTTGNQIFLTVIANSRTPAKLPAGVFSSAIAQLTPFGVKLNPGGKLTFPNTDGLPANAQARLYKLDQTSTGATLGTFVEVGTATVSADGQRIETAANAITETSIYFVALPRPVTTLIGRVFDSDGKTPIVRALVNSRGQETRTDGNGGFTLRNVPLPVNNQLSVEASFIRPSRRTDRVMRTGIPAGANGLTRVTPDLVLPSPATQPNLLPTLVAPTAVTITENQVRTFPLLVADPDVEQTVTVTVTGAAFASIVQVVGVNTLRLAPGANTAGNYTLTVRAADNQNGATTANVAVTVVGNRPPVLTVPGTQTGTVGQQLAFNVLATDPDPDQTLALTATGLPSGAAFNQTTANSGRFTWTPSANQTGSFTISFTATDNGNPAMSDTDRVTINVSGTAAQQWMQTAGPQGAAVRALLVNGSNVFAGTVGGVFRSTNDGANWTPASNGLTGQFVSSLAAIGTTLFAGTTVGGNTTLLAGGVFRSTDNGANWTAVNNGLGSLNILSLGTSGTTLFAGTVNGVYRSTDNGANWTLANNGLGTNPVFAFAAIGNNLFVGTRGTGGVFRSTDNGANWTPVNNGLLVPSVATLAAIGTKLFAGTDGGGVFGTANNGANWVPAVNGMGPQAVSALAVKGTALFAGTLTSGVFRTVDGGLNWTAVNNGLSDQVINAVAASSASVFAGTNSGVFRTTDNGANWAAANTGLSGQLIFSLAVNGSNLFAATFAGVFRTTNNGANWTAVNNGLSNRLVLSLLVNGGTLFAGTSGNGVFRSTNNGDNWTAANNGLVEEEVIALVANGSTLFAGTLNGGVFRSTDNGGNWAPVNNGLSDLNILALAVSGTTLFAATDQSGVFRSTDGGNNWTAVNNGLTSLVTFSLGVNGTTVFVGTALGLHRSTDNGANWTFANTGLGATIVSSFAVNGSSLFVGTGPGGVFRSVNNGTLWTPFNEGLTNLLVKSLAVSGNNIFAGTVGSSVFVRPLQ